MNDTGFALRVERVGQSDAAAPTLVLLPAAATTADDFVREGFIDELNALGIDSTVISAAAPVDVYAADRVVAMVQAQIGTTAGAAVAPLWFVGISLGAMTALACAEAHRSAVAGVFAIAPWPGPRGLWSDVPAIGLAAWAARQREARFDDERRVWRWLGEGARGGPHVLIGYGRGDRFAEGQQLLASVVPPARRFVVDGAHDWSTWLALWRAFLGRQQRRWRSGAPAPERRGIPDFGR
jgi:pimeloyl-ACP methyl ester carboxylesterase